MNYRTRWQQQRQKNLRARIASALGALLAIVLLVMLISRLGHVRPDWVAQMPGTGTPRLTSYEDYVICAAPAGDVQVFSATTGQALWPSAFRRSGAYASAPVTDGEMMVCVNALGAVCGVELATGRQRWEVQAVQAGGTVHCAPLIDGAQVLIGTDDGLVLCLNLADGIECWRYDAAGPVNSGFVQVGGVVILGTADGRILGLDRKTGKCHWAFLAGYPVMAKPVAVSNQQVVLCTDGGRIYLLSPIDGKIKAYVDIPGWGLIRAEPAVAGDALFIVSTDGVVLALKQADLQRKWLINLDAPVPVQPVVFNETLYCARANGFIHRINCETGQRRSGLRVKGNVGGDLLICNNTLVYATWNGTIAGHLLYK